LSSAVTDSASGVWTVMPKTREETDVSKVHTDVVLEWNQARPRGAAAALDGDRNGHAFRAQGLRTYSVL
jgi:hypothetical protein